MSTVNSEGSTAGWLAVTVRNLLVEKYGDGRVPGVRKIAADISAANDGEAISHGHIHNILTGEAENLMQRTSSLLARFFDKHPSYFYPPARSAKPDPDSVQALAARFATFDADQVEAIKQAIEIVTAQAKPRER